MGAWTGAAEGKRRMKIAVHARSPSLKVSGRQGTWPARLSPGLRGECGMERAHVQRAAREARPSLSRNGRESPDCLPSDQPLPPGRSI